MNKIDQFVRNYKEKSVMLHKSYSSYFTKVKSLVVQESYWNKIYG